MKFLSIIKVDEKSEGTPPQSLFDAMDKLIAEQIATGRLVDTGGLRPTAEGTVVRIRADKVQVIDGPFAEAREVVGGYAVLNVSSREEALEMTREFVQLHIDHWPGFEFECEIRQIEQP